MGSPTMGTQLKSKSFGPDCCSFKAIFLCLSIMNGLRLDFSKTLRDLRPSQKLNAPPMVFPMPAKTIASQKFSGYRAKYATKTGSELKGKSVADKKHMSSKPPIAH